MGLEVGRVPISRSSPRQAAGAGRAWREEPGDSPAVTVPCPQVAVLTLTLFPVRLLVALLMMLLAWPLALVSSLGPGGQEPEQPPVLWRR